MHRDPTSQRSPEGAAITQLILTIFRTNGRLIRAGDQMVRDLGLTAARWQVFGAIDRQPRTVAQIAREFELSRQGILWVVRSMVQDGLVELIDNPDHRRSKLVRMTDVGREKAAVVETRQIAWANRLASTFALPELTAAIDLVGKLGAAVADAPVEEDAESSDRPSGSEGAVRAA